MKKESRKSFDRLVIVSIVSALFLLLATPQVVQFARRKSVTVTGLLVKLSAEKIEASEPPVRYKKALLANRKGGNDQKVTICLENCPASEVTRFNLADLSSGAALKVSGWRLKGNEIYAGNIDSLEAAKKRGRVIKEGPSKTLPDKATYQSYTFREQPDSGASRDVPLLLCRKSCPKDAKTPPALMPGREYLISGKYNAEGKFIATDAIEKAPLPAPTPQGRTNIPQTTPPSLDNPAAPSSTEPPAKPLNLSAVRTSAGIVLSWSAGGSEEPAGGYQIYKALGTNASGLLGTVAGSLYTDPAIEAGANYSYEVAACDRAGRCSERSAPANITVDAAPNQFPVALIEDVSAATVGEPVTFSAARSYDPDGEISAYAWKFSDGQAATGATVSLTHPAAGNHIATLTVTDNRGASSIAHLMVVVKPEPQIPGLTKWVRIVGEADSATSPGGTTRAIVVDDREYVYATGETDGGGFLKKFSPGGDLLWSLDLGSGVKGEVLALDSSDNVYTAGAVNAAPWVRKYSPAGGLLWAKTFQPAEDGARIHGIAAGPANNVYVSGSFRTRIDFGAGTGLEARTADTDVFLVKLSGAEGAYQWSKSAGAAGEDGPSLVEADKSGEVLWGASVSSDIILHKFKSDGASVWSKSFASEGPDTLIALGLDSSGDVYINGTLGAALDFGGGRLAPLRAGDGFIAKLNSAGNHLWSRSFEMNGAPGGSRGLLRASLDGGAIVSAPAAASAAGLGCASSPDSSAKGVLVKFSPAGACVWSLDPGNAGAGEGRALAEDAKGNLLIGGKLHQGTTAGSGSLITEAGSAFLAKVAAPVSRRF